MRVQQHNSERKCIPRKSHTILQDIHFKFQVFAPWQLPSLNSV